MPEVADLVATQVQNRATPEDERLLLPSDLSAEEQQTFSISAALTNCECKLLEGHAFDVLRDIQTIVKTLTNLYKEKKHNYGQLQQTRSSARIQEVIALRDANIREYNATRESLIRLGSITADDLLLRPLKKADTYRKQTTIKRAVGDTYRHDGLIWTNRGTMAGTQPASTSVITKPIIESLQAATFIYQQ
ncbi:hypothetical protein CVT26_011344, partial [Gymnopilus dilepis]